MEKTIKFFTVAFGLAFGSTAGILASAAPGDLIYETSETAVEISPQQAGQVASWAIDVGAWDGTVGDMRAVKVYRKVVVVVDPETEEETVTNKFFAQVRGVKAAAPESLPLNGKGVRVLGIVE